MTRFPLVLCCAAALAHAQLPPLTPKTIMGTRMNLPTGWKVTPQQSGEQFMTIVQADPSRPGTPTLGLLAVKVDPARAAATTPAQWSSAALEKLLAGTPGRPILQNESPKANAVFHLYRLDGPAGPSNLSSYASVNAKSGILLYFFFSAPEQQFAAFAGPVFPLVAFAGVSPAVAEQVRRAPPAGGLQSQILEMDKRARQKIILGAKGWCYQGQPGCE